MSLRVYNTLSRALEEFSPIDPGHVRMYVCGMTIYDLCHIGHARMAMAFDVVQRWLKSSAGNGGRGYRVTYVRNITDIDDKIIKRALARNITIRALTDEMIEVMRTDIGRLGIEQPTLEPRATEYVPQMLALINRLEAKGLAYKAPSGDVNFAVRKFPGYGKLSGKSLDDLRAGERVAVQDDKGDPLDFVLWKAAKESEPEDAKWDGAGDTPGSHAGRASGYDYGRGRPGWHIECSAMCSQTLGETFDIHGGGIDLQFPHHENEIAQSEGASGQPLAKVWMHNGMVQMDNEKMSKSLGNFFTIREVLAKYKPETVRFFLVRAHYRTDLNYSDAHLDDAEAALKRLYTALSLVPPANHGNNTAIDWSNPFAARFKASMDDDFGTPGAVAVLFELATEVNKTRSAESAGLLKSLGDCLGLLQGDPTTFLQWRQPVAVVSATVQPGDTMMATVGAGHTPESIASMIELRAQAKAAKNFAEADRIRQELLGQGIVLKDSPNGTTWEAK
jgi:cysteinyl-tRNA synthetase